MWQIIINGPGYFDTAYELPEGVTHLGRADENDIVLGGDLVSRKHARLVAKGDTLVIEDLGSRNGSRVNGAPLQGGPVQLNPGDTVSLGENTLSVRQPHKVENAATEMVSVESDSGIRRFGHGDDVGPAVILAKNVKEADILAALDNFAPISFDDSFVQATPVQPAGPRVAYETLVLLFRTAEALTTSPTLTSFLESTMDRLLERTEATTAVVLLRQPGGEMKASAVRHRGRLGRGEVPVSDAIVDTALRQGSALVVGDIRDDRRFSGRESVILYGVDRVLCIPVGHEPPFAGVLYVNTSAQGDTSLEVMLDTCTAVAHLVATGVQKFSQPTVGGPGLLVRTLERFHSHEVAERRTADIQRNGGKLPGLEERNVTVLHAELVGFGALASRIGAERTTALLHEFHNRMSGLVFSYEGTVESFLGDSLRALFGTPYPKADDAVRAVRAALALRTDWEREMARRPMDERCELRIGLNTTKALVGLVGPESRPVFSAVGEGVNLTGWLAASAMPGQVLVTGKTLGAIGARFDIMPLGERLLRPPRDKVPVFEVLEEDDAQLTNPGVR